jgi:integrase
MSSMTRTSSMTRIIPIQKTDEPTEKKTKLVDGNQKALDALPLNSGTWRVRGIPGLYVRSRATSKSFMVQRRVDGELVQEMLGQVTMREAKEKAMARWKGLEPVRDTEGLTLGAAIEGYITSRVAAGKLSPKSVRLMRFNTSHYLFPDWTKKTLEEIGKSRYAVRGLQERLSGEDGPGPASANQVIRLLSAVYRWCRKVDADLPESPTVVAEIVRIPARDSALSAEALQRWWRHDEDVDGKAVPRGVSTLNPAKRMYWVTCLLTGARAGSVEAVRWSDVDLEVKVMRFAVAKGNRGYSIPMSDLLTRLLSEYKACADVVPSEWLFPSTSIDGRHIVEVADRRSGVQGAHCLRHTFRTTLAQLGAPDDSARLMLGHAMTGVSRGYITSSLVTESLRPLANAVAAHYLQIIPGLIESIEWK